MKNAARIGFLTALMWIGGTGFSGAASASEQAFQDWEMTCPQSAGGTGAACTLSTTSYAEDRTWLSTLRFQPGQTASDRPLQILVPPGVHLASGLFVTVPGMGQKQARYLRCTRQACDARIQLSGADVVAWKRARSAEVLYRPHTSAPPIRFQVSLMGWSAALEAADEGDR